MLRVIPVVWLLVVFSVRLSGQQPTQMKTLLDEGARISAFGGITAGVTPFNNDYTGFMGGDGALVLNNFYLGAYGSRSLEFQEVYPDNEFYAGKKLGMSQGGILTGLNFRSKKLIQYDVSVQIGWGNLSLRDNIEKKILTRDRVNIFTPSLQAKLNITSFVQLCAGVSYQFLFGVDLPQLEDNDFRGFMGSVSLRFGWF